MPAWVYVILGDENAAAPRGPPERGPRLGTGFDFSPKGGDPGAHFANLTPRAPGFPLTSTPAALLSARDGRGKAAPVILGAGPVRVQMSSARAPVPLRVRARRRPRAARRRAPPSARGYPRA